LTGLTLVGLWMKVGTSRKPVGPPQNALPESIDWGGPVIDGPAFDWNRSFLGHTKAAVIHRFGPPSSSWNGSYGQDSSEGYDPAVTLVYRRHSGAMYLSFCLENDEWVCFSADWLPNGWAF
jgi:hypothetical protein